MVEFLKPHPSQLQRQCDSVKCSGVHRQRGRLGQCHVLGERVKGTVRAIGANTKRSSSWCWVLVEVVDVAVVIVAADGVPVMHPMVQTKDLAN